MAERDLRQHRRGFFVFVISPDSCASEMCKEEIADTEANHKRLIPVICRAVESSALPPAIALIQRIAFTDSSFEAAFRLLIHALETDLDWVRSHTRLLVRARVWDHKRRDSGFLLRGMDLQTAIQWLAQASIREPIAAALQKSTFVASQEWEAGEVQRLEELNEQKERQRQEADRQRRIALARQLAAQSELVRNEGHVSLRHGGIIQKATSFESLCLLESEAIDCAPVANNYGIDARFGCRSRSQWRGERQPPAR
jgi:hypothetical protein